MWHEIVTACHPAEFTSELHPCIALTFIGIVKVLKMD